MKIGINEAKDIKASAVLMLTASTFPKNPEKECQLSEKNTWKYAFSGNNQIIEGDVCGYYQLEPVPKMLNKVGMNLDLIIIMASDAALKAELLIKENGEKENISAVDYLTDQLKKEVGFSNTKICIINTEKRLTEAISEAVYILRNMKRVNESCKFYLDTHGGTRADQENINAIVNLLRIDSIEFDDIFNVSGKNNPIESIKKSRIYDFAAGINEFVNFGSSQSLEKYIYDKENESNKKIVTSIRNISDALSLCDIGTFEEELDKLYSIIGEEKEYKPSSTYLEMFEESIRRDYGDVFNPRTRRFDTEIVWAYSKGYVQQALAMVESKTPDFFMNYVVINKSPKYSVTGNVAYSDEKEFVKEISQGEYEHRNHVLFNQIPISSENNRIITGSEVVLKECKKNKISNVVFEVAYPVMPEVIGEIEELIIIWSAIKKIRNLVMHVNGLRATRKSDIDAIIKAYKIVGINKNIKENITKSEIISLLSKYGSLLKTIQNNYEEKYRFIFESDKLNSIKFYKKANKSNKTNKSNNINKNSKAGNKSVINKEYDAEIVLCKKGKTWINLITNSEEEKQGLQINKANPGDGMIRENLSVSRGSSVGDHIKVRLIDNSGMCVFEMI